MEMERERQPTWITEVGIIAVIPVIAYLLAFFYEKGFYDYFSIPYYFISLNLTLVLATTYVYGWFTGYLFVTIVVSIIGRRIAARNHLWGLLIGVCSALSFCIRIFVDQIKHQTRTGEIRTDYAIYFILFSLFLAWILTYVFTEPAFIKRKEGGKYWEIFKTKWWVGQDRPSLWNISTLTRNLTFLLLIITFFIAPLFAKMGKSQAETQTNFPVAVIKQQVDERDVSVNVVILRAYGENLLAVPINRAEKKFEKKAVILKMAEIKDL